MNYQECLNFLDSIEEKVKNFDWEAQVDDTDNLLTPDEMEDYLKNFGLPSAKMQDCECIELPTGWLPNEPKDSNHYKAILENYNHVYSFMRHECSREMEALSYQYAEEDAALEREYWGSR
jgi:hypothetical protein